MPSNQQNQHSWSRLLAHYGPPSTETPLQQKPQQCGAIKTVGFIQQVLTTGDL